MLRSSYESLPKIEECKDEYPDEVDEMPVKPGYFHHLVIAAGSVVETGFDSSADNNQIDDADAYMQPVKTRNHEKE